MECTHGMFSSLLFLCALSLATADGPLLPTPTPVALGPACDAWPKEKIYGCTSAGKDWQKLGSTTDASDCDSLCQGQSADIGPFCCGVFDGLGCYVKVGAAVSSDAGDGGRAKMCNQVPVPSPTPTPVKLICSDLQIGGTDWTSNNGRSCCTYIKSGWCTSWGGYGPSWGSNGNFQDWARDGMTAPQACCACGGGQKTPTGPPAPCGGACRSTKPTWASCLLLLAFASIMSYICPRSC